MPSLVGTLAPARLGTPFRWLLASFWTSNLGDGLAVAAGPLLVASLTRNPFLVALAALLNWAPSMVLALGAGLLADRLDRRRIIVTADTVRVLVLVLLAVAIAAGPPPVGVALTALGLLACADVFTNTTSATMLPMLVDRDDLAVGNARLQGGFVMLNQLAGPPLGAALFAAGRLWPFVGQAVLVGAGVLLVSRVATPAGVARTGSRSARRDVAEGFRWLLRHAAVRNLALTILVFNVTFGAAWAVLVLYARERLGLGPVGYGVLTAVSAAGGLVGIAGYGWITRRMSLGAIMRVGLIVETLTHLGLAVTRSPWVAGAIFLVFGAHAFVWGTTSTTVRQRAVPAELQGRVGSVYTLCVYGGLVVGSAVGGLLAGRLGVTAPFWFAFAGSALFVVLLWRELLRIAHDDAPG